MSAEARSAIAQPDFSQIFASAASIGELLNWPSEDYLRGWGYLQPQEAPPMEYFNAFYNGTDTKLLYLFTAANIRKNSTAYQVDDVITSPNLDSKFWLVCTQAGTTDANEPDYSDVEANQEITDGTAKFLITPRISKGITVGDTAPDNPREGDLWLQTSSSKKTAELKQRTASGWAKVLIETILNAVTDSPIKTLERNTACNVNTVYAETTLPKGGFLICTQAGTTGASAATGFATAEEGTEVTDGTAKFVVHYFDELASLKSVVLTVNGQAPDPESGNINLQTGLNILARNKPYAYGDIAYSPNLPTWAYLYCVQAGTTAAAEPSFASVNTMGQYITDGTVRWIVDDVRFGLPVGVVFYDKKLRPGCVKFNGATVQRNDYVRIFHDAEADNAFYDKDDTYTFTGTITVSGTTITGISAEDIEKLQTAKEVCGDGILITGTGIPEDCMIDTISTDSVTITVAATAAGTVQISYGNIHNYPYLYGWGDGVNTFTLPDYRARVLQGGDSMQALAAGLPDIVGTHYCDVYGHDYPADGAFKFTDKGYPNQATGKNNNSGIITLKASYYNAIYGSSTTVQPPALQLITQIRY